MKTQFVSMLNGGNWYPADWVRDNDATMLSPGPLLKYLAEFKACCELVAKAVIAASADPSKARIPRLPMHFNPVAEPVCVFLFIEFQTKLFTRKSNT